MYQRSIRLDLLPPGRRLAFRTNRAGHARPYRYLNRFTLVCGSTGTKSLQSQFGWLHGATRSFPDQW